MSDTYKRILKEFEAATPPNPDGASDHDWCSLLIVKIEHALVSEQYFEALQLTTQLSLCIWHRYLTKKAND